MDHLDRITIEPGKMGGQPCIRGHRFTVEHLLGLVGAGWSLDQVQEDFPFIEAADVQQAIARKRSRPAGTSRRARDGKMEFPD